MRAKAKQVPGLNIAFDRDDYPAMVTDVLPAGLQLAGALTGSWLLTSGTVSYPLLFAISTVLRGTALVVLVVAVRPLVLAALPRLFVRLNGVRPNAGAIRGAVLEPEPERRVAEDQP